MAAKTTIWGKTVTFTAGLLLLGAVESHALSFDFIYGGYDWGTMEISVADADTLMVTYEASAILPTGTEATGFGFTFIPQSLVPSSLTNPAAITFAWDEDALNWLILTNLNAMPNPANSSLGKSDFYFGATEGNANNFTPPGILAGDKDVFYLNFSGVNFTGVDAADVVYVAGVRLQSIPLNGVNVNSLFLVGTPNGVPEPGTMLLLGSGLLGLGLLRRKKLLHK